MVCRHTQVEAGPVVLGGWSFGGREPGLLFNGPLHHPRSLVPSHLINFFGVICVPQGFLPHCPELQEQCLELRHIPI